MTERDAAVVIQNAFWQAGEMLMYHHTNPWELDEALCAWGYDVGPCEAQDLIGLEKVLALDPHRPVPILPRMVAEGRMGKGSGVGYYRYPGGGGAVIDPLIEDLILEEAWFGKITRSEIADHMIVDLMHRALWPALQPLLRGGMADKSLHRLLQETLHFPADRDLSLLGLSRT